nr:ATP-binding cassette sub-family A member 3-like isoform X2 [Halyomorpha halys]
MFFMSYAVLKAFLYKSVSIYRNRWFSEVNNLAMPIVMIVALLFLFPKQQTNKDNTSSDDNERGSMVHKLLGMDFLLDQRNSSTKCEEENWIKVNNHEDNFTEPRFHDKKILSEEKYHDGRIKWDTERMRMCGILDFYILCSYIIHSVIEQLIPTLIFSLLLKIPLYGPALIENIDFFSIFVGISLINLHATVYYITLSSIINSSILLGFVASSSYMYLGMWAARQNLSVATQILFCTFSPFSSVIMSSAACGLEESNGVTFKSLVSATDCNDLPLVVIALLMIIGSALFLLLFLYFLNINPGPHGFAKPSYYIFPQSIQQRLLLERFKHKTEEKFRGSFYQEAPPNVEVGIKIENLIKKFGNLRSVKKISLDIYSGLITAILGHNGAGKTTILSILSGMLSPTSGSAIYEGYNIFTNIRKFRENLGLCPQSDLLHPYLTVVDQLIFFLMLGGLSKIEAEESADDLLNKVGILEKKNVQIKNLSDGMQRKLCIALALVGKPKVIILDEPTSGVDPDSRREIWNLLLEERENKIVLFTTHFMEEADALGDRIAIMNNGEIVCYGSPIFLKKKYGAGYNIKLSCKQEKHEEIFETVSAQIPEAGIIDAHGDWLKFKLPFEKTKQFPELFKQLESNEEISEIGINCTSMEDIYLNLEEGDEEVEGERSVLEESWPQVNCSSEKENLTAYFHRFSGLLKKNMLCTSAKCFKTILLVFIVAAVGAYFSMDGFTIELHKYQENQGMDNKINEDAPVTGSRGKQLSIYFTNPANSCGSDPNHNVKTLLFTFWVSFIIFCVSLSFSSLVHQERISTVKHLMLMTKVSPITYWCSILLWDAYIFLIFVFISCVAFTILDSSGMFNRDNGICILFLILFLAGISTISSVYFLSLLFKTFELFINVSMSGVLFFGMGSFFIIRFEIIYPCSEILKLQPLTSMMEAIFDFAYLVTEKYACKGCGSDECADTLGAAYLDDVDLRNDLIFLFADLLLYLLLVILTDYGLFSFLWHKLSSLCIEDIDDPDLNTVDTDVLREKIRVGTFQNAGSEEQVMVVVDGLGKKYSRSIVAVVDVTFAVSKGECFGILGINGAGKTTVFNMLTGVLYPTKGNVYIKGYSLRKNKAKCLSMIGYCPQHSALIESLTARQMLTLFAHLRLIPSDCVVQEVKKWIALFGLDEYSDIPCKNFSGGNKRRLNTAMAFIGDPSIVILDEPTIGVDPFIRRNLWNIIDACAVSDQAIIISSHSMDECEAVCDRLTIVAGGKMECLGNSQHLKELHGSGYVIKITLAAHTDDELAALKGKIESKFSPNIELKDEHQVLLHYHITTRDYKISFLFETMIKVKNKSTIVDDYIISDSSLEEVFLSFAKKRDQEET